MSQVIKTDYVWALCILAAGLILIWPALSLAQFGPEEDQGEDFYPLQVPVIIDDRPVGTIDAEVSLSGQARLEKSDFMEVTSDKLEDSLLQQIDAAYPMRRMLSVEQLQDAGLDVTYDPANLSVVVTPPADMRRLKELSILEQRDVLPENLLEPAFFSAGTDFIASQRFFHDDPSERDTRAPFAAEADGFIKLGRDNPIYLDYLFDYLEHEGTERVQTTLFYDDVDTATRYAGGDISPRTIGFQVPLQMGGASIERQYAEIQPFRRTLPGGRSELILDQRSRVEVEINGVVTRTLTLDAGRYDVRDLPLVDGFNNVRLIVTNAAGAREVINYDFLSDTRLLERGLQDFSFSLGAVRSIDSREVQYDGPGVISGWYEAGLTGTLTLGAYGQATDEAGIGGLRAAIGTNFGLFGFDIAHNDKDFGEGYGAEMTYSWWGKEEEEGEFGMIRDQEIDLSLRVTGEQFNDFLEDEQINDTAMEAEARYQFTLPLQAAMAISARHQDLRGNAPDTQFFNATISRPFDRISVNLTAQIEREEDEGFQDGELFLSVSVPLGERDIFRTTASTDENLITSRWTRRKKDGVHQYGAEIGAFTSSEEKGVTGRFDYTGNRFGLEVDHDYSQDEEADDIFQETSVTGTMGIAFADGQVGIGRSVLPGFVILDRHKSIKDSDVKTFKGRTDEQPFTDTDIFGPAVIPVDRQYIDRSYDLEVDNLPTGYDLGAARIDILPGAYAGYVYQVGRADNIIIMGRLIGEDGEPVSYLSGKAVPVGKDEDAQATLFFTNRTGRLVSDAIAPGEYDLFIQGRETPIKRITIPEDQTGLYDIGTIYLGDKPEEINTSSIDMPGQWSGPPSEIDEINAPGTDTGPMELKPVKKARTGYRGYKYNPVPKEDMIVTGKLLDYNDQPVGDRKGKLIPLDGGSAAAIFKINPEGKILSESIAPGDYELVLDDVDQPIIRVIVPERTKKLFNIGIIKLKGEIRS